MRLVAAVERRDLKKGAPVCMFVQKAIYILFSFIISTLVSSIYRVAQTIGAQGIDDLKVETDSGIGGSEFMARRKLFQGREERFSY